MSPRGQCPARTHLRRQALVVNLAQTAPLAELDGLADHDERGLVVIAERLPTANRAQRIDQMVGSRSIGWSNCHPLDNQGVRQHGAGRAPIPAASFCGDSGRRA